MRSSELEVAVIEKLSEIEAGLEERESALVAHLRKQTEQQQRLMTHLQQQNEELQQLLTHVNSLQTQLDELQKQLGDTS